MPISIPLYPKLPNSCTEAGYYMLNYHGHIRSQSQAKLPNLWTLRGVITCSMKFVKPPQSPGAKFRPGNA